MPAPYTASVVGAGSGGKLSMRGLSASNRFELAAVTDLREEAREEARALYPNIQTFYDHRTMFNQCPTDIVCVSTWPPSHLDVTRDALDLSLKGILVEKPLGDTAVAGREILDRIRARNLPVAVPHGLLVAEHIHQILDRVYGGEIGDLKLVEIQCTNWDIINAGIHWLNFFVVLTQQEPIDHVLAACDAGTRTYRDGMQVETLAVTSVQTQSGIRAIMHTGDFVTVSQPDKNTLFRLVGTLGTIEFYAWEPRYRLFNAAHSNDQLIETDPGPRTPHQKHLENLADQIDRNTPDYTVAGSSLAALELCEAAYLSARHHCAVPFPLSDFTPPHPPDWDPGIPYSGSGGGRDGRKLS